MSRLLMSDGGRATIVAVIVGITVGFIGLLVLFGPAAQPAATEAK